VASKLTRVEVESRKAKAARFAEKILGDPELARKIESESLEE
jgi:hypothetical protein